MSDISERPDVRLRARRLLELLEGMHLSNLDFDNREHLQIIELCVDMAVDHAEKMSARRAASPAVSPAVPRSPAPLLIQK